MDDLRKRNVIADVTGKDFLATYLAGTASNQSWPVDLRGLVKEIKTWKTSLEEPLLYTESAPLLRLLNSISLQIFRLQHPPLGKAPALLFRTRHGNPIPHPFNRNPLSPDIVVEWGAWEVLTKLSRGSRDTSNLKSPSESWSDLVAVGEVKLKNKDPTFQLENYLQNLLHLRPEQNAVLGLSVKPGGYRLFYHDASVIHRSEEFVWTPAPLYSFIEKLYKNDFQDHSLAVLSTNGESNRAYTLQIKSHRLVSLAARPEPGPGQRRFVAILFDINEKSDRFQKDSWRDFRRRFFEGSMYAKAHHEKHIPGLMTILFYGYVLDARRRKLETTASQPEGGRRAKTRLISADVGQPLEDITSLSHFLRVMYDACVVQRNLYRKCNILHRDISANNIMVAPTNPRFKKHCGGDYFDSVKYINQILANNSDVKPEPACLVIDLGNGADLDQINDNVEVLAERTGTPKFIARSVSRGRLLLSEMYPTGQLAMPTLEGRSLELYKAGNAEYTRYTEMVQRQAYIDTTPQVEHKHRLFHDAESTFWVIAWTLARSAPKDYKEEKKWPEMLHAFVQVMETHEPGTLNDSRAGFLFDLDSWKDVLHPSLVDVAGMLYQMHRYIRPEWQYRPELDVEHVHEALMRLLLTEIVRIQHSGADVELSIGTRALPTTGGSKSSQGDTHTSSMFQLSTILSKTRLQVPHGAAPGAELQATANPSQPTSKPTDAGGPQPQPPRRSRRTLKPEPASKHPGLIAKAEAYCWQAEYDLEAPEPKANVN
ncbi:hypothetical protein FRC06_000829 [Ceratobasidium sp. 370]|nr:hypothetical protein FRC06_000829 [Ceratobasidium sp. 370]